MSIEGNPFKPSRGNFEDSLYDAQDFVDPRNMENEEIPANKCKGCSGCGTFGGGPGRNCGGACKGCKNQP